MFAQKFFCAFGCKRKERLEHEVDRCCRAFDVEKNRSGFSRIKRQWQSQLTASTDRAAARNVGGAKAYRIVAPIGAAFGVVRRPAGSILEEPNRADALFLAQVEPMPSAARNAEKVAGFDSDGNHVAFARMDVKQAAALDDEADFVFIVPMLAVEAVKHGFEAGRRGRNVNDVGGDVTALGFEAIDFRSVSGEDFGGGSAGREFMRRLPSFVSDANSAEVVAHFKILRKSPFFVRNGYGG